MTLDTDADKEVKVGRLILKAAAKKENVSKGTSACPEGDHRKPPLASSLVVASTREGTWTCNQCLEEQTSPEAWRCLTCFHTVSVSPTCPPACRCSYGERYQRDGGEMNYQSGFYYCNFFFCCNKCKENLEVIKL